MSRKTVHLKAT